MSLCACVDRYEASGVLNEVTDDAPNSVAFCLGPTHHQHTPNGNTHIIIITWASP